MQEERELQFLNGFEAISRGAYEGGATFFAVQKSETLSFPQFEGLSQVECYSSAETVAIAFGCALAGKRSQAFIRDLPLLQLSDLCYCGVNGALVIVYLEDVKDLQFDSRPTLKSLHLPILEPANPSELKRFIKIAYNMSEKYDVPIVVRCNEDMLNCRMDVEVGEPKLIKDRPYKRDLSKYALSSATLKLCADDIVERDKRLSKDCEGFPINSIYERNSRRGIIAVGEYADYANEVLKDKVLKLGASYPLPLNKIRSFAESVENLVVVEEHPFIQDILLANGIKCKGRELFSREGRHSAKEIAYALGSAPTVMQDTRLPFRGADFCKDCPYVPIFVALKSYEGEVVVPRDCSVYASGYLSVAEIAMDNPVAIASGFSSCKKPIVVLSDRQLLKECGSISYAVSHGVKIVVFCTMLYDINKLLGAFGVSYKECRLDEENFNILFEENVLIVYTNKHCKYEV